MFDPLFKLLNEDTKLEWIDEWIPMTLGLCFTRRFRGTCLCVKHFDFVIRFNIIFHEINKVENLSIGSWDFSHKLILERRWGGLIATSVDRMGRARANVFLEPWVVDIFNLFITPSKFCLCLKTEREHLAYCLSNYKLIFLSLPECICKCTTPTIGDNIRHGMPQIWEREYDTCDIVDSVKGESLSMKLNEPIKSL